MSDIITPLMGMTVPLVGSSPGPTYAIEINNDLISILDSHTHIAGQGAQIPVAGLNINADLPINNNNINNARSYRMHNSGSVLSGGSDICSLYPVNGDLYYNNASGTAVKLTNVASINSTNTFYSPKAVSANATILASDTFVYYGINANSGSITINLPSAALITPGRFYFFKDTNGISATNNIILSANGSDKIDAVSTKLIANNYGSCMLECDGSSNWRISYFADPGWFLGNFGQSGVALNLIGSTVNMTATSTGTINIGTAINVLSFLGSSYTFGFEGGNNFVSNADTTTINGNEFVVNSTSDMTVTSPVVSLSNALSVNGSAGFNGNTIIGASGANTLEVKATSTFDEDVTMSAQLTVNGAIHLDSATTCTSTLHVVGNATLDANISIAGDVTGTLSVTGSSVFTGSILLSGNLTTTTGTIQTTGSGIFTGRRNLRVAIQTGSGASNTTDFTPMTYDYVYHFGSLATTIHWTIPAGTFQNGDCIQFANFTSNSAGKIQIQDPAGNAITGTYSADNTGAGGVNISSAGLAMNQTCTVMYNSGHGLSPSADWRVIGP